MVEGNCLQSRISARISRELLIGILGEVITFQWLKLNLYLFGNRNRRLQRIYWEMLYMWPFRAGTIASSSTKIFSRYFVFDKPECFSSMAERLQEALLTPWADRVLEKQKEPLGRVEKELFLTIAIYHFKI